MDDIVADIMNGIVKSIGIILMALFFVCWQINVSKQPDETEEKEEKGLEEEIEPLRESEKQ